MENQEALYDLIQSIQSKMNVNTDDKKAETKNNENFNETEPQDESKINNQNTNNSNDFSNIASMLNNVDISSILGMLRQQK